MKQIINVSDRGPFITAKKVVEERIEGIRGCFKFNVSELLMMLGTVLMLSSNSAYAGLGDGLGDAISKTVKNKCKNADGTPCKIKAVGEHGEKPILIKDGDEVHVDSVKVKGKTTKVSSYATSIDINEDGTAQAKTIGIPVPSPQVPNGSSLDPDSKEK